VRKFDLIVLATNGLGLEQRLDSTLRQPVAGRTPCVGVAPADRMRFLETADEAVMQASQLLIQVPGQARPDLALDMGAGRVVETASGEGAGARAANEQAGGFRCSGQTGQNGASIGTRPR
jgi:hypothetical protein